MLVLGIDESGTGALAGPYTISGVVLSAEGADVLRDAGVTDSKTLSDTKRRELLGLIEQTAEFVHTVTVTPRQIEQTAGTKLAWVDGVNELITEAPPVAKTVIDGLRVDGVRQPNGELRFMPKADTKIVAVGAASIVAKTMRNDAMLKLAKRYPEYEWEVNYGYPSPDHLRLLRNLGSCRHHRHNYAPVKAAKPRKTTVVNIRGPKANGAIYIGRPGQGLDGPWGSPIATGRTCPVCEGVHQLPADTLKCYRVWLIDKLKTDRAWRKSFWTLRGMKLACFCAPAPCHGDVMAEILDK